MLLLMILMSFVNIVWSICRETGIENMKTEIYKYQYCDLQQCLIVICKKQ